MKVELEITFSKEEVHAMCLEKCGRIETAVEGKFEARSGYYGTGEVVCTFVPRHEEETPYIIPAPVPVPDPADPADTLAEAEF